MLRDGRVLWGLEFLTPRGVQKRLPNSGFVWLCLLFRKSIRDCFLTTLTIFITIAIRSDRIESITDGAEHADCSLHLVLVIKPAAF